MFTFSGLLVAAQVIAINYGIEKLHCPLQRARLPRYRTVSHASGLVPGTLWCCCHYRTRFMEQHHRHRVEVVRDDWNKQQQQGQELVSFSIVSMGTNTQVSSLNWISRRKTYSQGYNLIKYIKYILVSKYMKLSRNKNSGLAWLNTLVQYYAYNTLENYHVYNTLEKYWLKFRKMVPAFQYNKVDVMGNSCKKGS